MGREGQDISVWQEAAWSLVPGRARSENWRVRKKRNTTERKKI